MSPNGFPQRLWGDRPVTESNDDELAYAYYLRQCSREQELAAL